MPLKEGDRVEIIGIEKMESWVQKHFGNRDLRLYATGVDPGDPSDLGYFLGCGGKEIRPKGVQVKWREDQLFPLGGESKPKKVEFKHIEVELVVRKRKRTREERVMEIAIKRREEGKQK